MNVSCINATEGTIDELISLCNKQIQLLQARKCPAAILKALTIKKTVAAIHACSMNIPTRHVPLIAVVPKALINLNDLMPMVRYNGLKGTNTLNQSYVHNVIEVPIEPYFMIDVEDGTATRNQTPEEAKINIANEERMGITPEEGIALSMHKQTLAKHCIDCIGSYYKSKEKIPYFDFNMHALWLNYTYSHMQCHGWGSPSCAMRI